MVWCSNCRLGECPPRSLVFLVFLVLVSKYNNRKMTESEVSAKQGQAGAAHTQDLVL